MKIYDAYKDEYGLIYGTDSSGVEHELFYRLIGETIEEIEAKGFVQADIESVASEQYDFLLYQELWVDLRTDG